MKKKIIASILFLIVCITSSIIYATDATVQVNTSKSAVKPGEEVTFIFKIKDIVSEKGLIGLEGKIAYDTDKFEALVEENVEEAGAWGVFYNTANGKVIAEGSLLKKESDVIKVTLKVKEDSNLIGKTATVSINEAFVYDGSGEKELGTVSASVKIGEDSAEPETTPTPTATAKPEESQKTPTPTATAKPNGGSESTPTPSPKPGGANSTGAPTATAKPNSGENKDNVPVTNVDTNTSTGNGTTNKGTVTVGSSATKGSTTSSNSLPKAGIGSAITVLMIVVISVGTVAYIKLRKYNEI